MAIDLNKNRKYLKYTLPPLAVFVFILFAAPNILRESNFRLLKNNTAFEKQAPFTFSIINKELEVVQYDDYELSLKMLGDVLPEQVVIVTETGSYTMVKDQKTFIPMCLIRFRKKRISISSQMATIQRNTLWKWFQNQPY